LEVAELVQPEMEDEAEEWGLLLGFFFGEAIDDGI
jgi:hypothetical protein